MRVARPVSLNPEQRQLLERQSRTRSVPARQVERAQIVLRAADGWSSSGMVKVPARDLTNSILKPKKYPSIADNYATGFFRDLTDKSLRCGVFRDVEDLIMAIGNYIDHHNLEPKPFIRTAKATDILEKVKRARAARDRRLA